MRFTCTHCGWPVRVSDDCAGKLGRCPSCKGVVDIPNPGQSAEAPPKVGAMAGVANSQRAKGQTAAPAVPAMAAEPHPGENDELDLDSELDESATDACDDTDILPADFEPAPASKAAGAAPRWGRRLRLRTESDQLRQMRQIHHRMKVLALSAVAAMVLVVMAFVIIMLTLKYHWLR